MKKVTILLKQNYENGDMPCGLIKYNDIFQIHYKDNYIVFMHENMEKATFTTDEIEYMEIN